MPPYLRPATYVVRASSGYLDGDPTHYDAVCDGTVHDDVVLQNAINAIGSKGGTLLLSEGVFNLTNTVSMANGILVKGMGALERFNDAGVWQLGTTLKMATGFTSQDGMIKLPAGSHGIGFENLFFNGQRQNYPLVNAFNNGNATSFGSVQIYINRCQFSGCIPAIKAINAWEWWISECTFGNCGDSTQTLFPERTCAIYVKNQDVASTAAWSNAWHIVRCHVDTTHGIFFYSDYLQTNPVTDPNAGFEISFCEAEGNNEFIYGTFSGGHISHNDVLIDDLVGTGLPLKPILNLIGHNQGGYLRIDNNNFTVGKQSDGITNIPAITSTNYLDHITNNTFIAATTSGALIQLLGGSYRNTLMHNKVIQDYIHPLINDAGSSNTYYFNTGSEDTPVNGKIPIKIDGTVYNIGLV